MADTVSVAATDRKAGAGVLAAACVSAFVVNANTSAVTILLPAISKDLGAPIDQLQWAVTGYMLVGAAVIVTAGALGDVLGRRRVFLAGLFLFVASCILIALVGSGAGVIAGRMIQGAAGSTILACGMSLLSVDAIGRRADEGDHALGGRIRGRGGGGAAHRGCARRGHRLAGTLLDRRGHRRHLHPDHDRDGPRVPRSTPVAVDRLARDGLDRRDPRPPRARPQRGHLVGLALGGDGVLLRGLRDLGAVAFVKVEQRVEAPIVDLQLLRNRVLVGSTLAILIVAGALNALMYLLSLYFQDPSTFGMSPLDAGLATLPAAAAMILVTPLITPLAVKIGSRQAVALGFILGAVGSALLIFVDASWEYPAFVIPLILMAVGLGLANGPASSASTSAVSADQVGAASGISNMARYIGGSLAVAAAATVYGSAIARHLEAGASQTDALAFGLSRAALLLALMSGAGVLLAALMGRHRAAKPKAVHLAAAAAAVTHTIPTEPVTSSSTAR